MTRTSPMDATVNATYAARHFRELLDRVLRGDSIQIERHGQIVARLAPMRATSTNMARFNERIRQIGADETGAATLAQVHREFKADFADIDSPE